MKDESDQDRGISTDLNTIQIEGRTLEINERAARKLKEYTRDYLAELIHEADVLARLRGGDNIQSGDIEQAKAHLEGESKGKYWAIFLGSSLFGTGAAGLANYAITDTPLWFVILYGVLVVTGLMLVYFGAPSR